MNEPVRIRCREIREEDTDSIVTLLMQGFPYRKRKFWADVLDRMSRHRAPQGYPRYGFMLEGDGVPVGVLLLIFSSIREDGREYIRCNVSSWFVDPRFRGYAIMLVRHALRYKTATYMNVTPAPHTPAILESHGYRKYCTGEFVAVPALSSFSGFLFSRGAHVEPVLPGIPAGEDLSAFEAEMLVTHAEDGCISLICHSEGRRHPFVFAPFRKVLFLDVMRLAYCRSLEDFVRFAGPLGRHLARRGIFVVIADANGPLPGVPGFFRGNRPKYFLGPNQPRIGDLAYTERAMFGV